ncbi:unnamed protein product [Linum tenue]|uniref:GRIP domain-containing protein n=1 Tax=Linum tenue TaxID=586396 RepID=A0AAV0NTU7_9ROSI|nr:unnamed protein product [Linum tenue]
MASHNYFALEEYFLNLQLLARQQAQREEELAQSQRHILALQEEIEELERENRLHSQQVVKVIIIIDYRQSEVEALLPVVAMLLQFSPEEVQKCQQAYRASQDSPSPTPANDASGSGLSLLSRFSFS